MRKVILLVACLLALSMTITVYAHPGKTDYKGGHTNHNTGEYHYHHGYSPHDHYDMDGDGEEDCPHDFKDITDHSRKEIESSSTKEVEIANTEQAKKNAAESDFYEIVFYTISVLSVVFSLMSQFFSFFDEDVPATLSKISYWLFGILFALIIIGIVLEN